MTMTTLQERPRVGSYVRTPLGRKARVIGCTDDDRVRLDYESGVHGDVVDLHWRLLRHYSAHSASGVAA